MFDCTILVWEVRRFRRMKIGVIRSHHRYAVETQFRRTHEGRVPKDAAQKYFSDPVFREESRKAFVAAGFSDDAVEVEAFSRSLTAVAAIERQIASAQKRIATFTKDLERRYAERGARVALASLKASRGRICWRRKGRSPPTNATRPAAPGPVHRKARRVRE